MTYAMAKSPYLYEGQPETDRDPLQPFPALATGANPMSPLDMASGAQTIANEGLHMEPYYVEYIDDWQRRAGLHPRRSRRAGPRPRRRPPSRRRAQGRADERHRPPLPAQRAGCRQDRHAGQQHQRLVRRVHAAAHDSGMGRRPRRLHADGQRPGVRPGARPGWPVPDADLAGVHEQRPRLPARQRLGGTARRTCRRSGCTCRATSAST